LLSWFDKMEKKVGRYAISNLTLYLLIAYGIGYMTRFLMPELLQWLTLEPGLILKGQIWRIVSWIFVAPAEKPIYFLLMVWLYYSLGTTLERTWGTFRYNVYIISGMLFTVIGAFVLYGVLCATYDAAFIGGQTLLLTGSGLFSVSYIYMSIFLAFAVTYPDMEVLLYFIIPIKMKWMAWVYGAIIVYNVWNYFRQHGNENRDHCIDFKLYYILFINAQFEQVFTERTGPQGKVQTAVGASYDICQRSKTSLCGMRTDGTG